MKNKKNRDELKGSSDPCWSPMCAYQGDVKQKWQCLQTCGRLIPRAADQIVDFMNNWTTSNRVNYEQCCGDDQHLDPDALDGNIRTAFLQVYSDHILRIRGLVDFYPYLDQAKEDLLGQLDTCTKIGQRKVTDLLHLLSEVWSELNTYYTDSSQPYGSIQDIQHLWAHNELCKVHKRMVIDFQIVPVAPGSNTYVSKGVKHNIGPVLDAIGDVLFNPTYCRALD